MKIGILTQPLRSNYGGILQNWALQQVLRRLGHEPVTIRLRDVSRRRYEVEESVRCVIHNILHTRGRHVCHLPGWYRRRYRHMYQFVDRHIAVTREIDVARLSDTVFDFDAYVIGSDQVWRPMYNQDGVLEAMFCSSFKDAQRPVRLAYAASFGVDNWEFTPGQTRMAREGVSRFAAVSVRESSAVELCRRHLGVDASHVLDPTLLLDGDDYRSLWNGHRRTSVATGNAGVYILDETSDKIAGAREVCAMLGKEYWRFGEPDFRVATPANPMQPVEQWLASFEESDFVVTDSFHGMVFSILFRKPF